MPPARSKTVPRKSFFSVVAERVSATARRLTPTRRFVAYMLVVSSPVLVGVGVGTELGSGWGLVAGGVGAFGVGWLLGAE